MIAPNIIDNEERKWRCIYTKPKREHIAARHLDQHESIETFAPRVRYQKSTRRGKIWFTEAMFPGYTFARFDLRDIRMVNAANSVIKVVEFGGVYADLPEPVVMELQNSLNEEEIITVPQIIEIGDEIEVAEGPLQGTQAKVTGLVPARERVRILMDILGRTNEVEIPLTQILGFRDARTCALPNGE